jgi:histidinol dehydrogenase
MSLMLKLRFSDVGFNEQLDKLLAWEAVSDQRVANIVDEVIANVVKRGDEALLEYTEKFDHLSLSHPQELELSASMLRQAVDSLPEDQLHALKAAAQRVESYHRHQLQTSWQYEEADGTVLGQQISAMQRVGIYVPGGKATYPSSVLMNAIPAKVAGVDEIIMVVPTPRGEINPMVLAAAHIAGVTRVFRIGGAQAIAALAYGTASVPKVDKIVGPGNIFVATAKRAVFGQVGLDMIAGPSEILIVCDGQTNPDWIAMDLFSQAEHDENAQSILITTDDQFVDKVQQSIAKLLPNMERKAIIEASLRDRGAIISVINMDEALALINRIAPEHLELSVADAASFVPKVRHAGAIFVGRYTPEALGDYCAGPNHVLPTSGTARFSSPLGVYDFQKRSSIIHCSAQGASDLGCIASVLARGESLTAHAQSAEMRILKEG